MQYLLGDLKNAISDFEMVLKTSNRSYAAIIKNDYTKKEYNRINAVEFHIIEGHDLFDAIERSNNDTSHDIYIDLDFESEVFFEKYI